MLTFPSQSNLQLPGNAWTAEWTIDPLLGGTSAATTATLSGPSTGTVGVASIPFVVSLNGSYTGTATPSDSGAGGTFSPVTVSWSGSSASMTFTYTAAQTGVLSISITVNPSLAIAGSPVAYTVSAGPGTIVDYADPRQGTILL